ncbi:MAG: serine/threonine-protein kinase [Gemmatimonadota bacterium]|nr:serine/threonine-protein kinase [Gemmatimonadota bacterium]
MTPDETTVEFERRCRHCGAVLSATSSFCSRCGATAAAVPAGADALRARLGELLGAELDLERELGRGGMAAVFAAFDPALQRRVAVKVLLPEIAQDASMADRFLKEARTVAALQHPHVVTVYGVRSRDGVHAIVMELVDGRGLDAVLGERDVLPLHVAGMLLAQATAGLQHAHDRGVIHRDVKPSNVLIDRAGRAVVSDFGIARRDGAPRTTETGLVIGTWAYMSPEQRSADTLTPATDQYALGVMAFEVLTGRLPFEGTPSEMLRAHLHQDPPSVRALRADVPPAMDALIQRMMAKAPEDRFPSLRDAERAFRALVPDEGKTTLQLAAYSHVRKAASRVVAAVPAKADVRAVPTERLAPAGPDAAPSPAVAAHPPQRSRTLSVVGGVAVGITLLAAGWIATRGDSPPASQTVAPEASRASRGAAPSAPPEAPVEPPAAGGRAPGGADVAGEDDDVLHVEVSFSVGRGMIPSTDPRKRRPGQRLHRSATARRETPKRGVVRAAVAHGNSARWLAGWMGRTAGLGVR